jgi:hypothetical protein
MLSEWAADRLESLRCCWRCRHAGSPVWPETIREMNPIAVLLAVLGSGHSWPRSFLPWVMLRTEFPMGTGAWLVTSP